MKTLVLLALVGFVLDVGLALPFSAETGETDDAELKEIVNDVQTEGTERYSRNLANKT